MGNFTNRQIGRCVLIRRGKRGKQRLYKGDEEDESETGACHFFGAVNGCHEYVYAGMDARGQGVWERGSCYRDC